MPRGRPTSTKVTLTAEDRATLESWQRSTTIAWGLAQRARIILLMDKGCPITKIAQTVPISRRFVYKWTARFLVHGVAGLRDLPRRAEVLPSAIRHASGKPRRSGRQQPLSWRDARAVALDLALEAAHCTCDLDGRAGPGALCASCESVLSVANALDAYAERLTMQANREARGAID